MSWELGWLVLDWLDPITNISKSDELKFCLINLLLYRYSLSLYLVIIAVKSEQSGRCVHPDRPRLLLEAKPSAYMED